MMLRICSTHPTRIKRKNPALPRLFPVMHQPAPHTKHLAHYSSSDRSQVRLTLGIILVHIHITSSTERSTWCSYSQTAAQMAGDQGRVSTPRPKTTKEEHLHIAPSPPPPLPAGLMHSIFWCNHGVITIPHLRHENSGS